MGLFGRRKYHLDDVESIVLGIIYAFQRLYGHPLQGRKRLVALAAALKFLEGMEAWKSVPLRFYIRDYRLDSPQVRRALFYLQEKGLIIERSVRCSSDIDECDEPGYVNVYVVRGDVERVVPRHVLERSMEVVRKYGDWNPLEILREILRRHGIPEARWAGVAMPLEDLIASFQARRRER